MDADKLLITWEVYEQRALWQSELARAEAEGNGQHAEVARVAMAQLREVEPLEALHANGELVHLLVGRRWPAILDAREQGASWAEVGEVLGLPAAAAWEAYRRAIDQQQRYAPAWREADRARAVLEERYTLRLTPDGWKVTVLARHHTDEPMEWRVAPSDVSAETARERAMRLLLDLGRGSIRARSEQSDGDRTTVYTASVTPHPDPPDAR
jgi:hypothetical protein